MRALVAIAIVATLALPLCIAFAQQGNSSTFQNSPTLNSTQNALPIMAKMSDNKHYLVQLRWEPAPQTGARDIDMEIFFTNASNPQAVPNAANDTTITSARASNQSQPLVNGGQGQYFTDTSGLDRTVPVKSYDVTVYDGSSKVLWNKSNLQTQAGRGGLTVQLGNYTGPVTIAATNIKPMPGEIPGDKTDSVKFSATVVPEFPVAMVMLAGGMVAAALVYRFGGIRLRL